MAELIKHTYPNLYRLLRKTTVLGMAFFCTLGISELKAEEQAAAPNSALTDEQTAAPAENSAVDPVMAPPAEEPLAAPILAAEEPAAAPAADPEAQKISDAALEKYLEQQMATDFVYQREGRPDPFFPFITQEILRTEAEAEQLMGMRKFEPGQLTLVAIIFTEQKALAMVQDSAGIGYTLKKGDKIGRSGEVIDIVPNMVKIEEVTYSLTKEKISRTVEMVLKQEGDKQ